MIKQIVTTRLSKIVCARCRGSKICERCRGSCQLGKEATEAMRTGLNPQKQKESYETIKGMFGDFQSLEYVETWVPNDGSLLVIYRFKGNFTSKAKPEIRVVMDGNKKFSGFWILPWKDKM